jgi:hypothetical protein
MNRSAEPGAWLSAEQARSVLGYMGLFGTLWDYLGGSSSPISNLSINFWLRPRDERPRVCTARSNRCNPRIRTQDPAIGSALAKFGTGRVRTPKVVVAKAVRPLENVSRCQWMAGFWKGTAAVSPRASRTPTTGLLRSGRHGHPSRSQSGTVGPLGRSTRRKCRPFGARIARTSACALKIAS